MDVRVKCGDSQSRIQAAHFVMDDDDERQRRQVQVIT